MYQITLKIVKRYQDFCFSNRGGWKEWVPNWFCGSGINDSIVGIIGCGSIGTSIAEKLKIFKPAQILYTSRSEKPIGKYNISYV